jgi:hypothetical protein
MKFDNGTPIPLPNEALNNRARRHVGNPHPTSPPAITWRGLGRVVTCDHFVLRITFYFA